MNKRTIIASLNQIANELDNNGLFTEANTVTKVMSRLAVEIPPARGTSDTLYPGDIHAFEFEIEYILRKARANKVGHHSERNLFQQGYDEFKIQPLVEKLVGHVENSDRETAEQKILSFIDSRKKDFILNDEVIDMLRKALDNYYNITDNYFKTSSKTKVMSKIAMDENDEYNREDYFPYGDPDGDDEDEDEVEPSMYQEFHGGMDEIQDMMNPASEYSKPADLYESYSKKPYNPLYPEREALENVFSDLDRMLDDYMLSDKQKARYEQIKKRLMHISTSFK